MEHGIFPNNHAAKQFTIEHNIICIAGYIRDSSCWAMSHQFPDDICVLINRYFMTDLCQIFGDLILSANIVQGLHESGIGDAERLAQKSILSILHGQCVVTKGKTFRYDKLSTISISALQSINVTSAQCQVLILSASRESAQQLHHVESLQKWLKTVEITITVFECVWDHSP